MTRPGLLPSLRASRSSGSTRAERMFAVGGEPVSDPLFTNESALSPSATWTAGPSPIMWRSAPGVAYHSGQWERQLAAPLLACSHASFRPQSRVRGGRR
jgi:hypothetical protein